MMADKKKVEILLREIKTTLMDVMEWYAQIRKN
jgi:hypothetical protein